MPPVYQLCPSRGLTGLATHASLATPRGIEPRSPDRQSGIIAAIPWSHKSSNSCFKGYSPLLRGLRSVILKTWWGLCFTTTLTLLNSHKALTTSTYSWSACRRRASSLNASYDTSLYLAYQVGRYHLTRFSIKEKPGSGILLTAICLLNPPSYYL